MENLKTFLALLITGSPLLIVLSIMALNHFKSRRIPKTPKRPDKWDWFNWLRSDPYDGVQCNRCQQWCHPSLSEEDREKWIDAHFSHYKKFCRWEQNVRREYGETDS